MFRCILDKLIKAESAYSKSFRRPTLYPDNYVFDEDKSVKWNKEKVLQTNKTLLANHSQTVSKTIDELETVRNKLYDMIQKELDKKVSRGILQKIFNYVDMNNDGESTLVVSSALEETIDLINLIINDNCEG